MGSISEGLNELALGPGLGVSGGLGEVVEEEEDGEPEYMPPRAIREFLKCQTIDARNVRDSGDDGDVWVQRLTRIALPWESIGAVPCIDQDARIITQFPPLWSMIPTPGSMPELPDFEPGIESYPEQQGMSAPRVKSWG